MSVDHVDPLRLQHAPKRHSAARGGEQPPRERASPFPDVVQVDVKEIAIDLLAHPFPARACDRNIMPLRPERMAEVDGVAGDAAALEMSAELEQAHSFRS